MTSSYDSDDELAHQLQHLTVKDFEVQFDNRTGGISITRGEDVLAATEASSFAGAVAKDAQSWLDLIQHLVSQVETQSSEINRLRRARDSYRAALRSSSPVHSATREGQNKRYPDIPTFYGDRDRDTFDSWLLHLQSKFRQSACLFPTEIDKIDYIRDHLKATAYNVIKPRLPGSAIGTRAVYTTSEQLIEDLKKAFEEDPDERQMDAFDKIMSKNTSLKMRSSESFKTWWPKFQSVAAIAGLRNQEIWTCCYRLLHQELAKAVAGQVIRTKDMTDQQLKDAVETVRRIDAAMQRFGTNSNDYD